MFSLCAPRTGIMCQPSTRAHIDPNILAWMRRCSPMSPAPLKFSGLQAVTWPRTTMPKVMRRSTRRALPLQAQQQQDSTRTNGTRLSGSNPLPGPMSLNPRSHSIVTGSRCFPTVSIFFVNIAEPPQPWMQLRLLSTSLLRASTARRTPKTTTESLHLRWAHESPCCYLRPAWKLHSRIAAWTNLTSAKTSRNGWCLRQRPWSATRTSSTVKSWWNHCPTWGVFAFPTIRPGRSSRTAEASNSASTGKGSTTEVLESGF